ncbi:MAG: ATP-binding cassette domain-containing protein [Verrucomicrobia bacterium]|nr:ATP-binding cassette domain-containing protein [Verrucomicrobiota bacterium]
MTDPIDSATSADDDVVVRVDGVSKKFCRDLKKSLWYGIRDVAAEVLPVGRRRSAEERNRTLRDGEFWAVDQVSFELRRGECLGLMGHNGAGKTTLLKMLNGLIKPDTGRIEMRGRVGALIALGAGFNPLLTGRENILVNGSILGLSRDEIESRMEEIIDFAEIRASIDAPVQSYSSGMQVRLGFAVASALEPDILIADEVLAVGDFRFKWKCYDRIKRLQDSGVTILLVSHNAADLMRTCDKGLLMAGGRMRLLGTIEEAVRAYEEEGGDFKPLAADKTGRLAGARIEEVTVGAPPSTGGAGRVAVELIVDCDTAIPQARIVVTLHSARGGHVVFTVSSFRELGWIRLEQGRSRVVVGFSGFDLQAGSYSVYASVRGVGLDDFYDRRQSGKMLYIAEPQQNFEGFGVNGIVLPQCAWSIENAAASDS